MHLHDMIANENWLQNMVPDETLQNLDDSSPMSDYL